MKSGVSNIHFLLLTRPYYRPDFPFDVQTLEIYVRIHGPERAGYICFADSQFSELIPSRSGENYRYGIEPQRLPEWRMYEPRIICAPEGGFKDDDNWRDMPFIFRFSLPLRRNTKCSLALKPQRLSLILNCLLSLADYTGIRNVAFLSFIISSLSFTVFSIPADDNGQRLEITMGLLLFYGTYQACYVPGLWHTSLTTSSCRFIRVICKRQFQTNPTRRTWTHVSQAARLKGACAGRCTEAFTTPASHGRF